ncbi:siroheme synthase CysG [Methylovirgula sp. 4M-Z18]|uniref:siroheme synthase CysG n=1 Tax=Methylovirgula sp. 4M-Z18 TaxID=2293567 RepID=UPI000E2E939A|nr:siroheme synthase CysG [Methylovirgula sp. 4M-Z18]RFB80585.1 uroporphyrinogen-III C-methyltransferase [Methylovirgula sp. 4M-Z18]
MRYFPLLADTRDKTILLCGGGALALAKLRLLLKTEARIVIVSPAVVTEISEYAERTPGPGQIVWHQRSFGPSDLANIFLAYVATEDPAEDQRIAACAREAGILVNVVDTPDESTIITPAIVDRDPVVVAIGSEGAAPVLARKIKAGVEESLSVTLGDLVNAAAPHRTRVAEALDHRAKRLLWENFFDGAGEAAFAENGAEGVSDLIDRLIAADGIDKQNRGRVVLIGAGPGDPDLLTLKARKVLHRADVVLYDRLVDARILELARREATFIEVGKSGRSGGENSWKQSDIDALMIEHAKSGALVARLKSGDPLVFGRADEEIAACDAAGVPVTIVPGITAAAAAAASMGVSLTRRGRNSSITFLTARDVDGFANHDWRRLAEPGVTFAVYMGVQAAKALRTKLLMNGADPATPVTIVENASRQNELVASGILADLTDLIHDSGIEGPAVILVGLVRGSAKAERTDKVVIPFADAIRLNGGSQ